MHRLPLILGLVLIFALTVWGLYDFFITNEGVRYFSTEPRRLLDAVLLGVFGGLGAFGISRLSSSSQGSLKLAALGISGAFLLGVQGLFAYNLPWAAPIVSEAGMWGWIAAAFVSFSVMTVLVLIEFLKVYKRNRRENGQQIAAGQPATRPLSK
jgi:hypothetical protein